MTAPRLYQAYGLLVSSDLPLALPQVEHVPDDRPDIVLRAGSVSALSTESLDREDPATVASYESPTGRWYLAVRADAGYRLRFRDAGEFLLSPDFSRIEWIPQADGRPEILPVLFAGTVLAFVLTMQGRLVLHASAVASDGQALAFVGQSGRGKSTLATLLAADGARVLSDDLLRVDLAAPRGARCRGHGGELRLRAAARGLAAAFAEDVEQHETADARLGLLPHATETGWMDLGAVVVPSPSRKVAAVEVRRLPPGTALMWLLRFPRVQGLRPPDVLRRQFDLLGELVRRIPVYEVVIPWGPPFPPDLAAGLHAVLRQTDAVTEASPPAH